MESQQHPPQQACDGCRLRKTKCDRQIPCSACDGASIRCRYAQILRRRGPRGGNGRRLAQLKRGDLGVDKSSLEVVEVLTPTTFPRPAHGNPCGTDDNEDGGSKSSPSNPTAVMNYSTLDLVNANTETSGHVHSQQLHSFSLLNDNILNTAQDPQLLSLTLAAHVQAFIKSVFPTMPVVNTGEILADAFRLATLSPSRYAPLMSVCATTRLQLNLDSPENQNDQLEVDIPPQPRLTAEMLLQSAENACRQFHLVEDISVNSAVTSYFLFTICASLERFQHAWLYLNQSITLATSLGLDYEASYPSLPDSDREIGRCLFWILFVTERTFALQHRRPVRLRNCIAKPEVVNAEDPVVMNDLCNHISVFEVLPPALYEWHPQSEVEQPRGIALTHQINSKLCAMQGINSMIESQRFDTLITQQWLRVALWRLVFGERPSVSQGSGTLLPFSIPVDVGRAIMETLYSVTQSSIDCHGIAIEQKLCDIGTGLADIALALNQGFSAFEIGPQDLLSAVVTSLNNTRGGRSHSLQKLLKHSEIVLGYGDPQLT